MNHPTFPSPATFTRARSAELFEEAKKYFPGGVHSPVRAFKSVEGPPIFFKKGEGCHLYDVDNQKYVDFCCSWGPLILGHCHPAVLQRVQETAAKGMSFGAPTPHDNLIGKLMLDNHRYIEMIRFVSSGTEAVMSAIRLARGVTGRSKVIKFEGCYHGHVDSLLVKAGSGLVTFGISTSAGIPESFARETIVVPLADTEALESALRQHAGDVACVIIEPVPANNGLLLQDRSFLAFLREKCTEYGLLLIFDEVISGFRVGFEGAAGYYGIQPDIITFGKIIGGGMPVGAYAASAAIMKNIAPEGPVYQAGTLSANPVAMAAGYATLSELLKPGFYGSLEEKTQRFTSRLQEFCDQKGYEVTFPHIGSLFWPTFTRARIRRADEIDAGRMAFFKKMHLECLKRGVYFGPSGYEVGFISAAHTDTDLDKLLEFWEKCYQNPEQKFVAVADNFDKINPETFFGPELWESLSSTNDTAVLGGRKVPVPPNFHFYSVTHLGPGSLIEMNQEHFKRLGRQYIIQPNPRELLAWLRLQAEKLAGKPGPGVLDKSRLSALCDTAQMHRFLFYFLKSNQLIREKYAEGFQLGQGSNIRDYYRAEDLLQLKQVWLNHINGLRPARPLKLSQFDPLDYTVETQGLERGSNYISRQIQFLEDTGYLVEVTMVAATALLTALFGWWVFRRREQLIRRYGERAQQVYHGFEKQLISAEMAGRRLEEIKHEVDSLVMRRRLNYTEGLYFLAFIEDKVKRIEFARNVSENFLELFNAFMEDDILTESEYLKLKQFLQSIRHKIPAEIYEQFRDKVEQAYASQSN